MNTDANVKKTVRVDENGSGEKTALLGKTVDELKEILTGEKSFVASQLFDALAAGREFENMSSLSKALRMKLCENYIANPVKIYKSFKGKSGAVKYLYLLPDGNMVEGVFMPHDYGNTLCVSTQVGCRMGCAFCASGIDGLCRNLTAGEILGQYVAVSLAQNTGNTSRAITNIVLMGSGEPLDNYDNVLKFLDIINGRGFGVSERNISLSTSGLADKIRAFADSGHKVTLSISLHSPFDASRSALMPVNRKYPIAELIRAAKYYFEKTGRRVIFEYTLIAGENDGEDCIKELKKLTSGFPSHVNLIRLNEVKERSFRAPKEDAAQRFCDKLKEIGVSATIRRSLGNDIEGACGQLRRRTLAGEIK